MRIDGKDSATIKWRMETVKAVFCKEGNLIVMSVYTSLFILILKYLAYRFSSLLFSDSNSLQVVQSLNKESVCGCIYNCGVQSVSAEADCNSAGQ